jgi:hypothetical protein
MAKINTYPYKTLSKIVGVDANGAVGLVNNYPTIVTVTANTYTLSNTDHTKILDFSNTTPTIVTIPTSLMTSFTCSISQGGTATVQVTNAASVALVEADSQFKTEKQYVMLSLVQFGSDSYRLFGRTVA